MAEPLEGLTEAVPDKLVEARGTDEVRGTEVVVSRRVVVVVVSRRVVVVVVRRVVVVVLPLVRPS